VTAFNAPVAGSVERYDVHLSAVEFLPPQYQHAYDELVRQIQALKRENDKLEIPSCNEARAWQKAYASLKRREADEERSAVPMQRAFLDDQKAWREYIDDRNRLLSMLRHGEVDEHICGVHLDLVTDDMAEPLDEANQRVGGRAIGWVDRAQHIASALRWWDSLGPAEKQLLQTERVARRLKLSKERNYA
jgi:cell division protein FtsB